MALTALRQHIFQEERGIPTNVWPCCTYPPERRSSPQSQTQPNPYAVSLQRTSKTGSLGRREKGYHKPVGMPTDWCSTMVITAKKHGKPRRTIDYQHLNSQCKRKTHHTGSPFQLALQVPPNQKKTVLDAVDGYHSVPLDKASPPLTTFITEWEDSCT